MVIHLVNVGCIWTPTGLQLASQVFLLRDRVYKESSTPAVSRWSGRMRDHLKELIKEEEKKRRRKRKKEKDWRKKRSKRNPNN